VLTSGASYCSEGWSLESYPQAGVFKDSIILLSSKIRERKAVCFQIVAAVNVRESGTPVRNSGRYYEEFGEYYEEFGAYYEEFGEAVGVACG
jgi:hypothetical protein